MGRQFFFRFRSGDTLLLYRVLALPNSKGLATSRGVNLDRTDSTSVAYIGRIDAW
jgi:hypothetical protein